MAPAFPPDVFGGPFTPHGFCLAWQPDLLRLHIVSDGLIAVSYYSIPLTLGWLVLRRRDLAFSWAFVLFALFIMACGTTHVMDIWTLWYPDYWASGLVKAVTAAVSIATALLLWPLVPRILDLPSPQALADANRRLAEQIRETEDALAALRREAADRERAETMLRHSQRLQAIGELTGGIAHDFNNLLMVVRGNLDVLRRRLTLDSAADPQALVRYVERANDGVSRGGLLTRQLLAFARRQPLQTAVFDVNARIRALSSLLPATVGSRVGVSLLLSPEPAFAELDAAQFDTALLNLAINAGHAMPEGGTLTIGTTSRAVSDAERLALDLPPGEYLLVSITDTGSGMTPDVLSRAFEPFFTTRPTGQGSGLGLSQVYGFVRQSQGQVTLQSQPGEGTVVTLLLPRARNVAPQPIEAEAASD